MPDVTLVSSELKLAGRLDARFFALLEAIAATGSINKAARTAGYSYKGAWLLLETAGNLAHAPLTERSTGGSGGGGTRLTAAAEDLLRAWRRLREAHTEFLREQDAWLVQQPALAGILRRLAMKTTARNQFVGTIRHLESGEVTTRVTLALRSGSEITAAMTSDAARSLKLAPGREALALVKASAVVLVTDFGGYRLSARNQLAGTISRVEKGAVSTVVALTLPGGEVITSTVTNDAAIALGLKVGQEATAVFKAYAVMLAVRQQE